MSTFSGCDCCGSLAGLGVSVELVHVTFSTPQPNRHMVAREERRLRQLCGHVRLHPLAWRRVAGSWGHHRPEPDLLHEAHQKLGLPMCNLFSSILPQDAMRRLFRATDRLGNQPPLPAIFPDMEAPIMRLGDDGEAELVQARWGWSKGRFGWVTNVRNLAGWPWKHVIQEPRQRCLVPATSFAEYHPTEKDAQGRTLAVWFRPAAATSLGRPLPSPGFCRARTGKGTVCARRPISRSPEATRQRWPWPS